METENHTNDQLQAHKLQFLMEADKEEQNPYHPYLNQFHKESTERKLKELEEQKKLSLNTTEEAKKIKEMHERIARKYPESKQ